MKIVVLGGTGLIGRQLVSRLQSLGHDVLPASPSSGVNAVTGAGLDTALKGADVVVDVTNSPSFEDKAVREFFEVGTQNLLAAETAAGVRHHVALSIVGAERLPDSGYMRAKIAQEGLIRGSKIPFTILRATQFFEFLAAIGDAGLEGDTIHLTSAPLQPIASEDVVAALADIAVAPPVNGTVEVAGPEALPLATLVQQVFDAKGDHRPIVVDDEACYYGAKLGAQTLIPIPGTGPAARIGAVRLERWLQKS